ncbi:PaaI family thioesterase [Alteromonas sp. a30]|uniref:PaaI family thioesterase n=1 Tax=Alteromonas sp. a30 TaxID=2730917 RepID=UPI00227F8B82|nr:PaaI family thioesterase [Alteromonas sp. a30]MCY7296859.1 PaaI family thioesterase [Alteromonas sp. a30]
MATKSELEAFFIHEFPQANFRIDEVGNKAATISIEITHAHLRPGGTVSGPTLMQMADAALYVAILGEIGLISLAVTTNLNINFLRKPSADGRLTAKCRLIKMGKSLAVGDVFLYSDHIEDPVAHATGTYSIPPK